MDLQHKSSTPLRAKDSMPYHTHARTHTFFLFNKTISLFYSLFVFRLCYKIIGLSSLNLAGRGLAGLPIFGPRAWAGPETCGAGLGRTGLEKLLRAWTLTANCGLGLGSNSRPAQGTITYAF